MRPAFAAFAAAVLAASSPAAPALAGGRLLVELAGPPDAAALRALKSVEGVGDAYRFDSFRSEYFDRLYAVEAAGGGTELKALEERLASLAQVRRVERAHPIQLMELESRGAAPLVEKVAFSSQWGLENTGQRVLHDVDDVRSETIAGVPGTDIGWKAAQPALEARGASAGRDVVVAVLDSGVDLDHPLMQASLYRNRAECGPDGKLPFRPTEDKDKNGYIGDCMGWNFTSPKEGDMRPYDDLGHGTHVAGIVSLDEGNPLGLRSVSSRIKVLPVKVIHASGANAPASVGSITDRVTKGILYAIQAKADVINLSLGWPRSLHTEYLRQAVKAALDRGILIVAAAGNNSHDDPGYPCAMSGVLCVGSVDVDGRMSRFSNYGGLVDVLAPGDRILSLFPRKLTPQSSGAIGYEFKSGTSQAAPYVSAAAAVLRSVEPGLPTSSVIARLVESARPAPTGGAKSAHHGLIRLDRALLSPQPPVSLQPDLKAVQEIEYEHVSRRFEASIPLVNRSSAPLASVEARLEVVDGPGGAVRGVRLAASSSSFAALDPLAPALKIEGTLLDESIDSRLTVRVAVRARDASGTEWAREFPGQINLVRRLSAGEREQGRHPVAGVAPAAAKSFLPRTVLDRFGDGKYPEYYTLAPTGDASAPGARLTVYRKDGRGYSPAPSSPLLPGALELLRFEKADFDLDGRDDYLAISIAEAKGEKGPDGREGEAQKHILFSFLDGSLSPLYGARSHWRYSPDVAPIDPHRLSFMAGEPSFLPGRKALLPVFVSWGRMPEADLDPDVWKPRDSSKEQHAYYLEPSLEAGMVKLRTRAFDGFAFRDRVSRELDVMNWETIRVVALLPQTRQSWSLAAPELVLSVGEDVLRRQYLTAVGARAGALVPWDTSGIDFSPATLHPYSELDRRDPSRQLSPRGGDFVSFYSDRELIQSRVLGSRVEHRTYSSGEPKDPLFGYVRGFRTAQGEQYRFLQSRYRLHLWKEDPGQAARVYSRPIHRFSFLTGAVFNDLFFPVVSENASREVEPAVYVDATPIHGSQLAVFTLEQEELRARAFHSLTIPEGCKALNPTRFGETIVSHFAFACCDPQGNVSLEFYSMGAP